MKLMFLVSAVALACAVSMTPAIAASAGPNGGVGPAAVATTSDSVLGVREQRLIDMSVYAANGDTVALKPTLAAALDQGMTINEIKAVLVHIYAYCGFPRSLTALGVFEGLLKERAAAGTDDIVGREPTPIPEGTDMWAQGAEVQGVLTGGRFTYTFSRDADAFLKAHLFGDVFANDLLTMKDREIVTIAALTSLPAPAQLVSHFGCSMNVGWTEAQLNEFVSYVTKTLGAEQGQIARSALDQAIAARK